MTTTDLNQLSVNTIRTSMDAVQQANSGHPGTRRDLRLRESRHRG